MNRVLRLMDWTHKELFGGGKVVSPPVLDAPSILSFVKSGGQAVSCRPKAIVLNEALLACGFQSRRISFLPFKPDGDSHALVTVYLKGQGKWICVDPTFNTYFHNESGRVLGYEEIRKAYQSEVIPRFRPITIRKDWKLFLHGQEFESYDAWYAVYMAKNCFRAACPLASASGYESSPDFSRVFLSPIGVVPEEVERAHDTATHNLYYFFQKP